MAYKSGKGFFGDMMNLAKAAEETMQAPEVIEAFGTPVEHLWNKAAPSSNRRVPSTARA
jgi:hypothetical protein